MAKSLQERRQELEIELDQRLGELNIVSGKIAFCEEMLQAEAEARQVAAAAAEGLHVAPVVVLTDHKE